MDWHTKITGNLHFDKVAKGNVTNICKSIEASLLQKSMILFWNKLAHMHMHCNEDINILAVQHPSSMI